MIRFFKYFTILLSCTVERDSWMCLAAILLGSVKVPYEEIRRRIIEVDEDNLTVGLMEQLVKYLPTHDQMNQLAALKSHYTELSEPEQFVVVVCVISDTGQVCE